MILISERRWLVRIFMKELRKAPLSIGPNGEHLIGANGIPPLSQEPVSWLSGHLYR